MAAMATARQPARLLLASCLLAALGVVASATIDYAASYQREESRKTCYRNIQLQIMEDFRPYLEGFTGKTALIDVASIRDLGDIALWLGAKRIFFHWHQVPGMICGMTQDHHHHMPRCPTPDELLVWSGTPATFFWHAGGNFGDLYRHVHHPRMKYLQELENLLANDARFKDYNITMVQLPSSIYYNKPENRDKDRAIVQGLKHLKYVAMTRQHAAFDITTNGLGLPDLRKTPGSMTGTYDSIDMVYALGTLTNLYPHMFDVLLFLRRGSTEESQEMDFEQAMKMARDVLGDLTFPDGRKRPATFNLTDWNAEGHVYQVPVGLPPDLADHRVQWGLEILSRGTIIISNRLHGSILCMLADIPIFWFDADLPKESKLQSVYNKLGGCNQNAWEVDPDHCTGDNLRSWHMQGEDEWQSYAMSLQRAKAMITEMVNDGRIPFEY